MILQFDGILVDVDKHHFDLVRFCWAMNLHHSLKWNGRKDGCLDQIKATPWAGCLASPKTAKIPLNCPKTARMDSKATPWVHSLASPKTARMNSKAAPEWVAALS